MALARACSLTSRLSSRTRIGSFLSTSPNFRYLTSHGTRVVVSDRSPSICSGLRPICSAAMSTLCGLESYCALKVFVPSLETLRLGLLPLSVYEQRAPLALALLTKQALRV